VSTIPYIDTSALLKRYVTEPQSGVLDAYLGKFDYAFISPLTTVEFRCALERKRRAGDLDTHSEKLAQDGFDEDVRDGFFQLLPMNDQTYVFARRLLDAVGNIPLRTLDALHLAVIKQHAVKQVATADKTMARAAKALGISIKSFVA
jgi:uncharacterized protein